MPITLDLPLIHRLLMKLTKKDIHALIQKGETFHLECKKAQGGLPGSLLRRVGPKKGGHWEIVKPQPQT